MSGYYIDEGFTGGVAMYVVKTSAHKRVAAFWTEKAAQDHIDFLDGAADAKEPAATPAPMARGWSKAARRRAMGDHPLGTPIESGPGYTEYEDEIGGGGRVQIWDKA